METWHKVALAVGGVAAAGTLAWLLRKQLGFGELDGSEWGWGVVWYRKDGLPKAFSPEMGKSEAKAIAEDKEPGEQTRVVEVEELMRVRKQVRAALGLK